MLIISYDISNDKKRAKFAKFLEQSGARIQYSVFKIEHSDRFLASLIEEIQDKFIPGLNTGDSVYVFNPCPCCEILLLTGGKIQDEMFVVVQ